MKEMTAKYAEILAMPLDTAGSDKDEAIGSMCCDIYERLVQTVMLLGFTRENAESTLRDLEASDSLIAGCDKHLNDIIDQGWVDHLMSEQCDEA